MKNILWASLLFLAHLIYSQNTILPSELVNEFIEDESTLSDDISIEVTSSTNRVFEFKLILADQEQTFKIKPLSLQEFENKLSSSLSSLLTDKQIKLNSTKNLQSVKHLVSFIYGQLITELRIENTKPKIATVYLRDNISVFETEPIDDKILGNLSDVKLT